MIMNILHPKFTITFLFFTVVILLLILLLDVLATASDSDNELQDVVGKKEFITYCASCHGSDGKGNGPVVNFLKRKPADLTQLSKTNNGAFPFERIYGVFDGTYVFSEHGTSEMPIWGYKFIREAQQADEPSTTAKAKALDIILYIQLIQE